MLAHGQTVLGSTGAACGERRRSVTMDKKRSWNWVLWKQWKYKYKFRVRQVREWLRRLRL